VKLLLLEDEYGLRLSVKEFLVELGFKVSDFENGQDALESILSMTYDIIIMDVQVPGINGFDILKNIREEGISTPVIMVTSLTNISNLNTGYASGCNDYIKKPFELLELKLRIFQTLKMNQLNTINSTISLPNGYVYDTSNFSLTKDNNTIQLTKTEKDIVELLIKHIGTVISISDFQQEIWKEEIDSSNIRVQINNLRKKIGEKFIINIRGLGYKIESD